MDKDMDLDERETDFFVRYHFLHGVRHSDQQKERFINSLLKDLLAVRDDIKVIEARQKDSKRLISRNIYVGDVKKATTIIASYYDTPAFHIGSYFLLDKKKQERATLLTNLGLACALMLVGVILSMAVILPLLGKGTLMAWIVAILFYGGLSWLIGYVSRGCDKWKNLIRNTSSLLWLLEAVRTCKDPNIAFAFVDNGVTNDHGLFSLQQSVQKKAKLIYLDSIGAPTDLWIRYQEEIEPLVDQVGFQKAGLYRVFAANQQDGDYYLSKNQLNQRTIEQTNFRRLSKLLRVEESR